MGSERAVVMVPRADDRHVSVSGPSQLDAVDASTFDASGATTVDGDVRADTVDVSGTTDVGGVLAAERLDASGALEVAGETTLETADLSGSATFGAGLTVGELDTSGALEVADRLAAERLASSGRLEATTVEGEHVETSGAVTAETVAATRLEASGDLEAEEVTGESVSVAGHVDVDRLVADRVRIEPGGDVTGIGIRFGEDDSRIGHLEAEEVHVGGDVEEGFLGISMGPLGGSLRLVVEQLQADVVDIEETTVTHLHAREATLGPGTEVAHLHAAEWTAHEDAEVGTVHEPTAEHEEGGDTEPDADADDDRTPDAA